MTNHHIQQPRGQQIHNPQPDLVRWSAAPVHDPGPDFCDGPLHAIHHLTQVRSGLQGHLLHAALEVLVVGKPVCFFDGVWGALPGVVQGACQDVASGYTGSSGGKICLVKGFKLFNKLLE